MPERDKPFDYFIQGSRILDNGRSINTEFHFTREEVANMPVKGDAYRIKKQRKGKGVYAPSDCKKCKVLVECRKSRERVLCEEIAIVEINGMEIEW